MNTIESQIIKINVMDGSGSGEQTIASLNAAGWQAEILNDREIYCHGTEGNDFRHTYTWTILCTKAE